MSSQEPIEVPKPIEEPKPKKKMLVYLGELGQCAVTGVPAVFTRGVPVPIGEGTDIGLDLAQSLIDQHNTVSLEFARDDQREIRRNPSGSPLTKKNVKKVFDIVEED